MFWLLREIAVTVPLPNLAGMSMMRRESLAILPQAGQGRRNEERITLSAQRPKSGLPSVEREYQGPPEIGLVACADFPFRERNGSVRSGRRRWMSLFNSRQ
jgi:hypothetical protein